MSDDPGKCSMVKGLNRIDSDWMRGLQMILVLEVYQQW